MANELEKTGNIENAETTPVKTEPTAREKELEAEIARLKQSVTNASADASKWKKQVQEKDEELKARMTEDERASAEREAAEAAKDAELEELRTKMNVADHKTQFMALGFSADLAQEVSESLKGIKSETMTVLYAGIRKFIESHDKELTSKSLLNNPVLSGGETKVTMTKEQFNKLGYKDRLKLHNEQPELYKELTS